MLRHIDTDRMPSHIRLVHSEDPATTLRRQAWEARRKAAREQAEADRARSNRRAACFVGTVMAGASAVVVLITVFVK